MTKTAFQSQVSTSETTAVSLLTLMMHAEASAVAPTSLAKMQASEPYIIPLDEICTPSPELTAYMAETLQTITQAVFSQANEQFYGAYKGYSREAQFEIVLTKEDLRPLAYRAVFYTERHIEQDGRQNGQIEAQREDKTPFAPRFVQSLLLLQKHWDANFLQPFKDVAGNLSLNSINKAYSRVR